MSRIHKNVRNKPILRTGTEKGPRRSGTVEPPKSIAGRWLGIGLRLGAGFGKRLEGEPSTAPTPAAIVFNRLAASERFGGQSPGRRRRWQPYFGGLASN